MFTIVKIAYAPDELEVRLAGLGSDREGHSAVRRVLRPDGLPLKARARVIPAAEAPLGATHLWSEGAVVLFTVPRECAYG